MKAIFQYPLLVVSLSACVLLSGCTQTDSIVETAVNSANSATSQLTTESSAGTETKLPAADQGKKQDNANGAQSKMAGMSSMAGMGKMKFPASADMKFKDKIKTNVEAPKEISELVFTGKDGSTVKMSDYVGKKNVILVFTEGFNGMICPFCKTQTSRLVSNYDKFKERDCEVIVVYPGPTDHLDEFVEAALKTEKDQVDKVPFPIVLDENFAATNYFDIHSMHAHPSTYLIDKKGSVQFAYVGNDMTADRPSVKAMLKRLDQLEQ